MLTVESNTTRWLSFGRRYLVVGILCYILSVYVALNTEISIAADKLAVYSLCFLGALGFVGLTFCCIIKHREARHLAIGVLIVASLIILGFCRVHFFNRSAEQKAEHFKPGTTVVGVVKSTPKLSSSGKTVVLVLDVLEADTDGEVFKPDSRCKITLYVKPENLSFTPSYGDCVTATIHTQTYTPPAFKGDFDHSRYLLQSRIVYSGLAISADRGTIPENSRKCINALEEYGFKVRNKILDSTLLPTYGANEKALLMGLLAGETLLFSSDLYEKYTDSGFIHIASVSGMHTSYLFLTLSFLLGAFYLKKRWISVISILCLVFFAAVSLFTPSVLRAVIMMSVLLSANLFRRTSDTATSLAVAAALLVTENPYCLESYSFLMSFGATIGIIVFYPLLRYRLGFLVAKPPERITTRLRYTLRRIATFLTSFCTSSVCLSISGTLGLAYFTMRFFGKLQLGGIIGNIIIFPITAFCFIGGYINCIVYHISKDVAALLAHFYLNPALKLTNSLADLFSAKWLRIENFYVSDSFFVTYILICIAIYVLLYKDDTC